MIKQKVEKKGPIEIDLTGPDGNAFVILGLAKRLCKEFGMTKQYEKDLLDEMTSGDYENLIQTFDKSFGSVVTMYR
jgi:hypothetical protein|tara:strand:- start:240 stop:467 length:228 start_codon:yes stop_codon:yes gene_type:complete